MKKIITILFFYIILLQILFAQNGWVSIPSGTSSWLRDVKVVDQNNVYIVGYGYTILKSTNLGTNWVIQFSGNNYYNFYSVSFINQNTGFVVGGMELPPPYNDNYSVVVKTLDGGNSWYQTNQLYTSYFNKQVFAVDSSIALKSSTFGLSKTIDGGYNWSYIQAFNIYSFYFFNALTGFTVGGYPYRVYKTTDGGNNWMTDSLLFPLLNIPTKIFFANQNTGYISVNGNSCYLFKTTNSGINWSTTSNLPNIYETYTVYCMNSDTLYVTGRSNAANNGRILKSTDGGQSWVSQYYGGQYTNPYSISFLNNQTGFAVGPNGLILKTTTGGDPVGIQPISKEISNSFSLSQNYPNPFNPTTKIKFDIAPSPQGEGRGEVVKLIIYDILGREVVTLVNEELKPGSYEYEWDGSKYAGGVYFYKLETESFSQTRRMILLK